MVQCVYTCTEIRFVCSINKAIINSLISLSYFSYEKNVLKINLSWRLNSRSCCSSVLINTSRKYLLLRSWLNRFSLVPNPQNFLSFCIKQWPRFPLEKFKILLVNSYIYMWKHTLLQWLVVSHYIKILYFTFALTGLKRSAKIKCYL